VDISIITQLIQAVKSSDVSVLEVSDGDLRVRIERGGQVVYAAAPVPVSQPATPPPVDVAGEAPAASGGAEAYKIVSSPLVGIFRPVPADKGIAIGARVKKGTAVCFVEAMKLMNEILMPEDGTLVWIAPNDGDAVEYGQTLFHYN